MSLSQSQKNELDELAVRLTALSAGTTAGDPALEAQLAAANEAVNTLSGQLATARNSLANVEEVLASTQEQLATANDRATGAEQALATAQEQLTTAQSQLTA